MNIRSLESLPPTETLEIENGLSLLPRVRLLLTIHPSTPSSVTKPIDEWKLKRALIEFLKTSFSVPITVPEEDLHVKRFKDLKKRKREEAVAHGTLFIRDLGFISNSNYKKNVSLNENNGDVRVLEKKFVEWRSSIIGKMDGIELNLEGVKYKLSVALPQSDDFEGMKREWEELQAFGNRGL